MENVVYFPETPFFPGGNWSKWGVAMQPICRFLEAGEGDSVHAKRPQFSIQTNDKLTISVRVSRRGPMSCSVEFTFDDFFHFSVVDTLCCLPFYWCSEKGYCHGSSWSLFLPLTLVQVGKCYPCCQGSDIIGGFHWSVFELKRSRVSRERSRCGIWPRTQNIKWWVRSE